jgi:hypothetical protein
MIICRNVKQEQTECASPSQRVENLMQKELPCAVFRRQVPDLSEDWPARPSSGYYGVFARGKRWRAYRYYGGKKRSLGAFGTKQEAALAYDQDVASNLGGQGSASTSAMTPRNHLTINAAEAAAVQAKADYDTEAAAVAKANPQKLLQKPTPPSGFYGVYADRKRWIAQLYYDNKEHSLGTFDTKHEAALAYDKEIRQRGEDRPLNYESIAAAEEAAAHAQAEHKLAHPPQPKPRPASGFYGVYARPKKRWTAQLYYDSKTHNLGTFDTKHEAALAYDKEARQRGEDRPLNYESIAAAEEASAQAQAERILVHDMCAGPQQPKPRPPSGFYGVYADRKRWIAQIHYDSKQHSLGSFDTKQEAALAYDREARQCGEDKLLNYESIKAAEEAAAQAQAGRRDWGV